MFEYKHRNSNYLLEEFVNFKMIWNLIVVMHSNIKKKSAGQQLDMPVCSFISQNSFPQKNNFQPQKSIYQILILFCYRKFGLSLLQRIMNRTLESPREVNVTEGFVIQQLFWHAIILDFVQGLTDIL